MWQEGPSRIGTNGSTRTLSTLAHERMDYISITTLCFQIVLLHSQLMFLPQPLSTESCLWSLLHQPTLLPY